MVSLHRCEKPGNFHKRGDGSVVYMSQTINGQLVAFHNAGPPTFRWDEVRLEAEYGWAGHAGHAGHAGYNEQVNGQAEVYQADEERTRPPREAEPDSLLYEQWQHQNPPPDTQDHGY
ncbi:hypothetical protein LZ30DRAFT_592921 [Colletotrichum cereale]|nr:hypothetical protein LZ30DRAFT_592921 [Colletotrichum cereale]